MDKKGRKKPGRKVSDDPAINRYSIKLNSVENDQFLGLHRKSGQKNKADFIKSMLFGRQMKVIYVDKGAKDFYMRLTNITKRSKPLKQILQKNEALLCFTGWRK